MSAPPAVPAAHGAIVDSAVLRRLADLVVQFGANVQRDQIVSITGEPGKEALVRAIAASAYARGARFVDLYWFDPWLKRARIAHARDETLDYVPPWYGQRMLSLGEHRAARIALTGPAAPDAMGGLDPVRAGRDHLPALKETGVLVNERTTNWTAAPCPTPAWAGLVYPDLPADVALGRLWQDIVHVCRLDEPDPVAAWGARGNRLTEIAGRLTALALDELHFRGPGTDLRIGLLPSGEWLSARFTTVDGIEHVPNIPSEEVFTTPDPLRADGVVRSTKPLVLADGTQVCGLAVRFASGRAVAIDAETGVDTLRTICARDEGAGRLGEVALVDAEGRIGPLNRVFWDTLLDENAASHIAFGQGFPFSIRDEGERRRSNASEIHLDFMLGSSEIEVTGRRPDGSEQPVLARGRWCV